jgi:hypothetical protein
VATQAQDIFNRALAINDANQGFATLSPQEILWRLNYGQGQLWALLAQENRFFWARSAALASSAGASPRTLDLSALAPPVERILYGGIILPSGTPLNIVDYQDQGAAGSPRGYPIGQVLQEVGTEWGNAGAVNFTIVYAYRPADLLINTDLTQAVSVPDRFALWLDIDLGIYFSGKDPGRSQLDPQELQRLAAMQEAVYQDILQYVDHLWGPMMRRYMLPTSVKGEKA